MNALCYAALIYTLHGQRFWMDLSPEERFALDMIFVKVSRLVQAKADRKEHWEDIRGYADLILEGLT